MSIFSYTSRQPALLGVVALVLITGLGLAALCVGQYPIPPRDAMLALFGMADPISNQIVLDVRLPRLVAALVVGAALAGSGAAYQMLFRNPLVSPDILGVSTGASLGAVLGIFTGLSALGIQAFAFVGGIATVGTVVLIGQLVRKGDSLLTMVLIGLIMAALTGALTSLVKVVADPYDELPAMTFWLLGSLANVPMAHILSVAAWVALCTLGLFLLRWPLNTLAWGKDEAQAMGLKVQQIRFLVVVLSTLMSSAVVSLVGVVGWVGLLVPHAARLLSGPGFPRLLPVSMLLGGLFLAAVDTLARAIATIEVPLGVVTAIVGAPFFLFLLVRRGAQAS